MFVFKQMTAYELRISDWSSDVCSSDLLPVQRRRLADIRGQRSRQRQARLRSARPGDGRVRDHEPRDRRGGNRHIVRVAACRAAPTHARSEEHTSELQSLMRISYAVFCLKKKKKKIHLTHNINYMYNYILKLYTH